MSGTVCFHDSTRMREAASSRAAPTREGLERSDCKLIGVLDAFRDVESKLASVRACQAPPAPMDRDWTAFEAIDNRL